MQKIVITVVYLGHHEVPGAWLNLGVHDDLVAFLKHGAIESPMTRRWTLAETGERLPSS